MRAESLRRVVNQILLETQELMNAARSQCVAQQLQLNSPGYPTEAALKRKIKGKKAARMAHQVQQMNRGLSWILLQIYYRPENVSEWLCVCSCVPRSVCE